ncbi:MAG: nucleotide exchange factor GrpE [Betaproteobacteria bacterium]
MSEPDRTADQAQGQQVGEQAGQHAANGASPGAANDASQAPRALGSASVGDVEHDLQAALAKANENYDLYLRAKAEGENIRRRAQDDIAKASKYAIESFAEHLVPVMDSLDKALEMQNATAEQLREGVEITRRQLKSAFERGRLAEINPVGEKFDPHKHQAISAVPAPEGMAPNHVVAVLQKGWLIADRVLRPALVTVSQ